MAIIIIPVSLLLASCVDPLGGVDFIHYDGISLKLSQIDAIEKDMWLSTTFVLERPVTFLGSSDAIAVELASSTPQLNVEALVHTGEGYVTAVEEAFDIPRFSDAEYREYRMPVPEGTTVSAIRISSVSDEKKPTLISLHTDQAIHGYRYDAQNSTLMVGTGIDVSVTRGNPSTIYEFDVRKLAGLYHALDSQIAIDVQYVYPKKELFNVGVPSSDAISVTWAGSAGRTKSWALKPRRGNHSVHLYEAANGFHPSSVQISSEDEDFALTGFEVKTVEKGLQGQHATEMKPLPADLGTIILYDDSYWRSRDFELFSWNLYPTVILIDLRDYALQSRFFKRLAFFVEKDMNAGRLMRNDELDGLHGWNAHDYWAPDLARFFRTADKAGFVLNPEEELLREILFENGILVRSNPVTAGEGAILSLARESSDYLRRIFINHEGYHGLYFANTGYRNEVARIWDSLSETEKDFWRYFLQWKKYDVSNEELMANEFQAYLMQQATSLVDGYFIEYNVPRMATFLGDEHSALETIVATYPDMFRRAAELVENAAYRETGVMAFDLLDLSPIE